MEPYSDTKEATTNTVKFTITPESQINFESNGIDECFLTDAIQQVSKIADNNGKARQKIQEIQSSSEIASHFIFFAFLTFVVSGLTFTLSRAISTHYHQTQLEVRQ